MDTFNMVLEAIKSVGYPIAISCALLWYCFELNRVHKEETDKFTEAINNVTLALQQLTDFLRK